MASNNSKHGGFIRLPELLQRLQISAVTLWRWERAGLFPKRTRLGPRIVAWNREEVEEWEAERLKERADEPTAV